MEKTTTTSGKVPSSPTSGNNRTLIIIVIVAIILILGGILMKRGGLIEKNGAPVPTSIKALMALGIPQQCSFSVRNSDASGESVSNGTVYVSGGKMRADTETRMNTGGMETNMMSHMFSDGEYYYLWSDADRARGIKTKIAEGIPAAEEGAQAQNPPINPEVAMDYRCTAGISDASKLEIPKDVTFTDMNEMMEGMMREVQDGMMPRDMDIPAR
jgi:hypothetical protein